MAMAYQFPAIVTLLFLFAVSYARTIPLDLRGSETNNAILLPTQKLPEPEPSTATQREPEATRSHVSNSDTDAFQPFEFSSANSVSVPLTDVSFRPVNRHAHGRPYWLSSSRHGHHFQPWNPRIPRREIPYGDDMIFPNGKDWKLDPMSGVRRNIPTRWPEFRHDGPSFPYGNEMERDIHPDVPHGDRHRHHHDEEGEEIDRDHYGFMKRFRKFLPHF